MNSLFRAPDNDLADVDLAPGKGLEGLLQGHRTERNYVFGTVFDDRILGKTASESVGAAENQIPHCEGL
jgi:hypothetical protein